MPGFSIEQGEAGDAGEHLELQSTTWIQETEEI